MKYIFENDFQKTCLIGAYFIKHPDKREVSLQELNDWLIGIYLENKETTEQENWADYNPDDFNEGEIK